MIPILYDKTELSFTGNGLGYLTEASRCIVTEERNGEYVLELDYPVTGKLFSEVKIGNIIYATHDEAGDYQPFDIYRVSEPIEGVVTAYANHISYRLNEITVFPFEADSCADAMAALRTNSMNENRFTFWTNKVVLGAYKVDVPRQIRSCLGGEEGSLLDVYGTGEYEFDMWNVKLHARRGGDTEVSIRYGKNLIDFLNDIDSTDVYNAVAPYWKGNVDDEETGESTEEIVYLTEGYISSGYDVDAARQVVVPMDLSDDFEDKPTQEQLRTRALAKLLASYAWLASQNVKVDFVQLWQTEEFKDLAPLQRARLCDTVLVTVPMYGIHGLRIKIIKVVWNALLERYDEMELGDPRTSFADTLTKQVDTQIQAVAETAKQAEVTAGGAVTSDTLHYLATSLSSGVTTDTPGWTLTVQSITSAKPYLWIYHTYGKANGSSVDSAPVIIGRYGQDGTSVTILGSYDTLAELEAAHPTGSIGDAYMVAGDLYVWNGTAWEDVGQIQGPPGQGVTVSSTTVSYQQSTNGSTPPTGTWSSTAPAAVAGKYMWTRTIVTYSDGQQATSYTVSKNGANGEPGDSVSITSTSVRYQKSAVGTTPPTGTWTGTIPSTDEGDYLWTRTIVNYSDGTSTTSYSVGRHGLTGAAGVSVAGVTEHYLATSASSGVTKSTSGWTETVQTMTQTNQYLWNYETTYDSDGNVLNETDPVIIGRYGQNGSPGKGITGIVEWYQIHTSNSNPPASATAAGTGWSTTPMATTTDKPYLWNYEVINYTTGSPTITTPAVIGTHGTRGATGPQGVSVTKVEPEYYMSTSSAQATGGQWDDELNYVAGRYIWTHEKITYSNGSVTYSTAIYNSALTQAWINANSAYQVAANTNQHFWFTETGDDTGAHITEKTQEDFLEDPLNGGGNLLARSNGIAVRHGLTELATFTGSGAQIGQGNGHAYTTLQDTGLQTYGPDGTQIANLGYGQGYNAAGNLVSAPFASLGTRKSGAAVGNFSVAEGVDATASGYASHAEGTDATASGPYCHAEGCSTTAYGTPSVYPSGASHAEGWNTRASGAGAHAEGVGFTSTDSTAVTTASGTGSHAEGYHTTASGAGAHAEGRDTTASGDASHAAGVGATASGLSSYASGSGTVAQRAYQHVIGTWNELDTGGSGVDTEGRYVFIIGNGGASNSRSNALTVDWDGNLLCNNLGVYKTASNSGAVGAASGTATAMMSIELTAGTWLLIGHVRFPANANGYRRINISPTAGDGSQNQSQPAVNGNTTDMNLMRIVRPSATTRYYLNAWQNSGSTLSMPSGQQQIWAVQLR